MITASTTLWVVTPIGHHMERYFIATLTCSSTTFRVQNSCGTIFVSVFFVMSKVPEKGTTMRGVLILTLTFVWEVSILQQVIGGQVLKERNNWKLSLLHGFGESGSKLSFWLSLSFRTLQLYQ
jgi:hypothetical protein